MPRAREKITRIRCRETRFPSSAFTKFLCPHKRAVFCDLPKEKSDRIVPSLPPPRQDFSLFRWPMVRWKTHVSAARQDVHDRSVLVDAFLISCRARGNGAYASPRHAIKRKKGGEVGGSPSLTTVVEKQNEWARWKDSMRRGEKGEGATR